MRFLLAILAVLLAKPAVGQEFSILAWNVESRDSDRAVIKRQLTRFDDPLDIVALSGVTGGASDGMIADCKGYRSVASSSVDSDRLMVAWDDSKFEFRIASELKEHNGIKLDDAGQRPPLVVTLRRIGATDAFHLMNCHLACKDPATRIQQATALTQWAHGQTLPVIAVGTFNMDFVIKRQDGNEAFSAMLKEGAFRWIKPIEMIDTKWADKNRDGTDDEPDTMSDLVFAKTNWDIHTKVVVRDKDFPDDRSTSNHRPTLTTVTIK